jgi:Calcineurin-like phosphoesterase
MAKRAIPDDDKEFQITVCETELNAADQKFQFADGPPIRWAGPNNLQRIVVLGDTGCDNTDAAQRCADGASWPFHQVTTAAAAGQSPDLVVHVGDYRYREGDRGDNWENWKADFFDPAKELLAAAPWVMVRGNHEVCFRTQGKGWFYLLQPAIGPVGRCESDPLSYPDHLPPYALDISDDLRFVVVDSANAKYRCDTWVRYFDQQSGKALKDLVSYENRKVWLLTHYPVWDVSEAYVKDQPKEVPDDEGLKKIPLCESAFWAGGQPTVFGSTAPYRKKLLELIKHPQVQAVLSGDTHQFQVLRVDDNESSQISWPLQIVAGNGGTRLWPGIGPSGADKLPLYTCEATEPEKRIRYFRRDFDGHSLFGKAVCTYGYVTATKEDSWSFRLNAIAKPPGETKCDINGTDCYKSTAGAVALQPPNN